MSRKMAKKGKTNEKKTTKTKKKTKNKRRRKGKKNDRLPPCHVYVPSKSGIRRHEAGHEQPRSIGLHPRRSAGTFRNVDQSIDDLQITPEMHRYKIRQLCATPMLCAQHTSGRRYTKAETRDYLCVFIVATKLSCSGDGAQRLNKNVHVDFALRAGGDTTKKQDTRYFVATLFIRVQKRRKMFSCSSDGASCNHAPVMAPLPQTQTIRHTKKKKKCLGLGQLPPPYLGQSIHIFRTNVRMFCRNVLTCTHSYHTFVSNHSKNKT